MPATTTSFFSRRSGKAMNKEVRALFTSTCLARSLTPTVPALRYIRAMMTSEGFCLDMLFWAAKQAQELDLPDLAKYCFAAILEAAQTSPGEIKGADPLLLARWV